MVTPACSFSRSFWLFREWSVFFPWHDYISTSPILSAVPLPFMWTLCSSSIHRSPSEGIIPHAVVDLLYPWEDMSSRSSHAILNLPSPLHFLLSAFLYFFLTLYFLLLCYLLISSNVGFGKHFSIYIIYYSNIFEFLVSSRNSRSLQGVGCWRI